MHKSWPTHTQNLIMHCWAQSTLNNYNHIVSKFATFCVNRDVPFPPSNSSHVAHFLSDLACQSTRPKSILNNTVAALSCLYEGYTDVTNPLMDHDITRLCTALVKTHTCVPRKETPIIPTKPIKDLFLSWPDNAGLTIKQLRQKTLALLALVMMLRPSDAAPRALVYDSDTGSFQRLVFSTDQISFHSDGSASIALHGIKNDYKRDGFIIHVDHTDGGRLDPVQALKDYILRTEHIRPLGTKPVFLTLTRPYNAITSPTVAKILEEVIAMAGLDTCIYKAKCFRPTGATLGIETNCTSDAVRQTGRWRNRDVFEEHYVHSRAQRGVAAHILSAD